jgi:hypothetical protein
MDMDEIARVMNTSFVERDGLENTPVYAAWIAVQLTLLATALDENISAECIALTAETLMTEEPQHLDWALERARRECVTFPKPCEILALLREIPSYPN